MTTRALAPRLAAERRFYFWMAAAVLATVFAGFAPSFYLRGVVPAAAPLLPLTPVLIVHGLVFSSWVVLFMVQVGLVSAGRSDLHRRLGIAGFGLVIAMAVIGIAAGLAGVARPVGVAGLAPASLTAIPLFDVPVFTGFILMGLAKRRDAQLHKRLMMVAMIAMLSAPTARILLPVAPLLVALVGGMVPFFLALAAWDLRSRGAVHRVTWIGAIVVFGAWALRLSIMQTSGWVEFVTGAYVFVYG